MTTLEDDGELVFERGWIGVGVRSGSAPALA
jgi:hypothetical protein